MTEAVSLLPYPNKAPGLNGEITEAKAELSLVEKINLGVISQSETEAIIQVLVNQASLEVTTDDIRAINTFNILQRILNKENVEMGEVQFLTNDHSTIIRFTIPIENSDQFLTINLFDPFFVKAMGLPGQFGFKPIQFDPKKSLNDEENLRAIGIAIFQSGMGNAAAEKSKEILKSLPSPNQQNKLPNQDILEDAIKALLPFAVDRVATAAAQEAYTGDLNRKLIPKNELKSLITESLRKDLRLISATAGFYDLYNKIDPNNMAIITGSGSPNLKATSPVNEERRLLKEFLDYLEQNCSMQGNKVDNPYINHIKFIQIQEIFYRAQQLVFHEHNDWGELYKGYKKVSPQLKISPEMLEKYDKLQGKVVDEITKEADLIKFPKNPQHRQSNNFEMTEIQLIAMQVIHDLHSIARLIKEDANTLTAPSRELELAIAQITLRIDPLIRIITESQPSYEQDIKLKEMFKHPNIFQLNVSLCHAATCCGLEMIDGYTLQGMKCSLEAALKFLGPDPFPSEADYNNWSKFHITNQKPDDGNVNDSLDKPFPSLGIELNENLLMQIRLEGILAEMLIANDSNVISSKKSAFLAIALSIAAEEAPGEMPNLVNAVLTQSQMGFFASEDELRSIFGTVGADGEITLNRYQIQKLDSLQQDLQKALDEQKPKPHVILEDEILTKPPTPTTSPMQPDELLSSPAESAENVPSSETKGISIRIFLVSIGLHESEIDELLKSNPRLNNIFIVSSEIDLEAAKDTLLKVLTVEELTKLLPYIPELVELVAMGVLDQSRLEVIKRHQNDIINGTFKIRLKEAKPFDWGSTPPEKNKRGTRSDGSKNSTKPKNLDESVLNSLIDEDERFTLTLVSISDRTGLLDVVHTLKLIGLSSKSILSILDKNPSLLVQPKEGSRTFSNYFYSDFLDAILPIIDQLIEEKEDRGLPRRKNSKNKAPTYKEAENDSSGSSQETDEHLRDERPNDLRDILLREFIESHANCFAPSIKSNIESIRKLYEVRKLSAEFSRVIWGVKTFVNHNSNEIVERAKFAEAKLQKYGVRPCVKHIDQSKLPRIVTMSLQNQMLGYYPEVLGFITESSDRYERILNALKAFSTEPLTIDIISKASGVNPIILDATILRAKMSDVPYSISGMIGLTKRLQQRFLEDHKHIGGQVRVILDKMFASGYVTDDINSIIQNLSLKPVDSSKGIETSDENRDDNL